MTTAIETGVATHVYTVYTKAAPETVWEALTTSEWTSRYGYRTGVEYELRPGGAYLGLANEGMRAAGMAEVAVDGEVIEAEAPNRLVQTWHPLFSPEIAAEAPGRVTVEIDAIRNFMVPEGVTRLRLTHELDGAPLTAAIVGGEVEDAGGGWAFVLSDLKTLLESGKSLLD